uniref:TBK1 inhibitor DP96R n=1 Tax=African swine fever virus (isolate Tick/South Africa/Pretoriuskop Pr4/1996) TaxID=561443 RepID=DP96R_ASFP4|nr:RecName: Full=TBK1 inhibitor DP96R [African swine fever virus tick/South Africa/Pretoriuskop Pr4/1996]
MSTHNNSPKEKPVDMNNISEKLDVVNNAPEKPAGANHIPEKLAEMTSSEWIAEYWKGINRGNDVPCCCPRKMTSADKKFSVFGKGYLMRSMQKDD